MTHQLSQACIETFHIYAYELVSAKRFSRVYHCESDIGSLAVKVCIDGTNGEPDSRTAKIEYSSMQLLALQARTAGETRLCPDAIGLIEEHGTVAMTWEQGVTLTGLLLSRKTNARDALEIGKATGNWLARFHDLGNYCETSNDLPEKISLIKNLVAALPRYRHLMTSCFSKLEATASRAGMIPLPTSWALGDFKSDNLLVNGGHVIGIDIHIMGENPVIYNVAQFLAHLNLLCWTPRGLLRWPILDAAGKGFLSTYLAGRKDLVLPIVWLRTIMLLQRSIDLAATKSLKEHLMRIVAMRALAHSCMDLNPYL